MWEIVGKALRHRMDEYDQLNAPTALVSRKEHPVAIE